MQDLAWAVSYYARFLLTYSPFYGILGAVLFLNFIRYLSLALTGLRHGGAPCGRAQSSPLPALGPTTWRLGKGRGSPPPRPRPCPGPSVARGEALFLPRLGPTGSKTPRLLR